ncbi:MAG TPA: PolC-type DNA polymerase III [Clostridiaceae bacterium]|nr:PolC-type DNA polymerase III [Clostridiaceae bacterium]
MQGTALQDKGFLELFPEGAKNYDIIEFFKDTKVKSVNLYRKSRKIEVFAVSEKLIPAEVIDEVEQSLAEKLQLGQIKIKIRFNVGLSLEESLRSYWDSIMYIAGTRIVLCKGILAGCSWNLTGNQIDIRLKTKGSRILKSQKCDLLLENFIEECFGYKVKVVFTNALVDDAMQDEYFEFKEMEEARALSSVEAAINENKRQAENEKKKKNVQEIGESGIILGKNFDAEIIKMREVNQDSGKVAVRGDIFAVDCRELRGGRFLFKFDITDYTSSLSVKFFAQKDNVDTYKERLKEGLHVKVRGEAQYDRFAKEPVIMAYDIVELKKQEKMDTADEKRVELHLHTQMSSMDGITSAKELVERAAKWGHKAIAITDHGVVQAYPDAYAAAKKNNIKVIYGVECYLVDDDIPVVYFTNGHSIDNSFVVFDIETTGLDAVKDRIIEIGAVKIHKGEIVDRFSSFVNPEIPIPEFIVKLTGINDEMVKDAPTIEKVLNDFLQFTGDVPFVAHNAMFDTGFIKYNARKLGFEVSNPIVDTLQLSRNMFPELKKYKLDVVAKHLGVKLDNHHRAVDDAEATANIFLKCLEILKSKNVSTIDEIQNAFESNTNYMNAHSYHGVILVRNQVGLKNLYKLVSESHLKYYHKRPRMPKSLLMAHREGLIFGSACEAGELYSALLEKKSDEEIAKIVRFYDYLEIQPLGNNKFLIDNGKVNSMEDLKNLNRKIVELGEKFGKPVVATCDVHFIDPQDEVFRRILMAGQGFSDADNQAPLYFRTTDEMLEEFSYLGSEKAYEVVVTNTNRIADMVDNIAPVPEGTFPPHMEGAEDEIKELAVNKAKEIYGEPLPKIVQDRLDKELNSIIKNGFSVMYLIAQKLVHKSNSDGYLVGSRGSVGSSFVANMVGITEVNSLQPHYICENCKYSEFITDGSIGCGFDLPDKDCPECGKPLKKDGYDIPFETFLGFDGDKEPDIDLNFSGEYQPVAHKYTEELFGEGHVFRAGTIGTIAEKTAYGFVKNYLDERGIVVTSAEINRLVKGCTGVKRTTGQHPGGIMIVPQNKEIFDFSPIQKPADDVDSNVITTHFDYHFLHGSILKLDILGHDDPTVIRMLEDLTGVNAKTIPIGEKRTMGIFSSTEPLGIKPEDIDSEVGTFAIPEFGTKFVRQMLVDTRPTTFSELIRISGLSHGTDVWLNNAQDLVRDGTATLSQVICCRDDIMIYLMHAGLPPKTAFKIMEDVRKGKGLKEEYEQVMREHNVPDWYIQSCKKIKYMFPKAHAAAYVMMAFRIAWFKVYYPEAFYATYFTVRADDFDAELMTKGQDKVRNKIKELEQLGNNLSQKEKNVLTILEVVNEMYARGIKFLPVDLYHSDATRFLITPQGIRPPLNSLQGLGTAAAQNIAEARKEGEFKSIDDLRVRGKASKSIIEILQKHGCLEGLPESSQMTLF